MESIRPDQPIVYLLRADDGPVKIGTSLWSKAEGRFRDIQSCNHHELTLIRIMKGSYKAEKWFQDYFAEKGLFIRGEWFNFHPDMMTLKIPKDLAEIVGRVTGKQNTRKCPRCGAYFELEPGNQTMCCSETCQLEYQARRGYKASVMNFRSFLNEC